MKRKAKITRIETKKFACIRVNCRAISSSGKLNTSDEDRLCNARC